MRVCVRVVVRRKTKKCKTRRVKALSLVIRALFLEHFEYRALVVAVKMVSGQCRLGSRFPVDIGQAIYRGSVRYW